MSTSFDLPSPDVFTAGTIGPPGQRVFYLQVRDDELVVTLRCEKQQVAALADYFDGLLDDLEPAPYGVAAGDLTLTEPAVEIWTVGAIGVAYDEPGDRIVVVLEELTDRRSTADRVDEDEESEGASVKVRSTEPRCRPSCATAGSSSPRAGRRAASAACRSTRTDTPAPG